MTRTWPKTSFCKRGLLRNRNPQQQRDRETSADRSRIVPVHNTIYMFYSTSVFIVHAQGPACFTLGQVESSIEFSSPTSGVYLHCTQWRERVSLRTTRHMHGYVFDRRVGTHRCIHFGTKNSITRIPAVIKRRKLETEQRVEKIKRREKTRKYNRSRDSRR